MIVEFFGPQESRLMGVFHKGKIPSRPPLLLCSSLGHENLRAHRALRILAERWGGPAFRFDWRGCGDSSGEAPLSIEQLIEDLHFAAHELVQKSGTSKIMVVGLRLGALFAQVAKLPQATRVIGWFSPASGSQWIADLRAIDEALRVLSHVPRVEAVAEELVGLPFYQRLQDEIKGLSECPSENVTLAYADDWSLASHCEVQWLPGPSLDDLIQRLLR